MECVKCKIGSQDELLINIDPDGYFCEACLIILIKTESEETIALQQKHIFQMQFESIFDINHVSRTPTITVSSEQELAQLHQQEQYLDQQINLYKKHTAQFWQKLLILQQQQISFWDQINRFERRANKLQEKAVNSRQEKLAATSMFQMLSTCSPLHQLFKIQYWDSYAEISGMCIGKRPEQSSVNFEEISVGLGHMLLLIHFLAVKAQHSWRVFRKIEHRGQHSKLYLVNRNEPIILCENNSYKLYGQVAEAILTEIIELSSTMSRNTHNQITHPYKMNNQVYTIAQKSVDLSKYTEKSQKQKWTAWTFAMRCLLINLKHIINILVIQDAN